MRTKVEKLRDVSLQDLVEIYSANPHEPEAESKVLMAIIYGLVENMGETCLRDSYIKQGLQYPDEIKMEKVRYETDITTGMPDGPDGLRLWLEEDIIYKSHS